MIAPDWRRGMDHYVPILVFTLVAISVPIIILLVAKVVRFGSYDPVNAVLFVVFDVETIFLFPWAVIFDKLALFGFVEMMVFLAILLVGYLYAWRRGALEWA
jgi:NADH-quinone oxidoreductase subunit A